MLVGLLMSLSCVLHSDPEATKKANAYFEVGEFEKAITSYQEILKKQEQGIKKEILTYNLGSAYLAKGEHTKAIEHFFRLLSHDEQVPKHLLERTHYNLIISYLNQADHFLDHLDEDSPMTSVQAAHRSLALAKERYDAYSEMKYPDLENLEELPQEIVDLKHSLKELNSKFKRFHQKVLLDTLSFQDGLDTLSSQTQNRLLYLDSYLQSDLESNYKKYLLTLQYISEKETLPFWKRMQEIIQTQYDEAEKKALHKDKVSRQQDADFELQSTHLALFDQANNRHLTSLDYLKEYNLLQSRLEQAKSKCDLKLMELAQKSQDGLEFCLKEKIMLKKREEVFKTKVDYTSSLQKELSHYNMMAIGLAGHFDEKIQAYKNPSRDKKTFSKLDELSQIEELDVTHQLINRLKARLEKEDHPDLDKLYKDYFLYMLSKKKPEDFLLKAYQRFKEQEPLSQKEIKEWGYQFFAVLNHFEVQHNFSYDEWKNKRISYALEHLAVVQDFVAVGKKSEAFHELQNILIQWNFEAFVIKELEDAKASYAPLLEKITFSKEEINHLAQANQDILEYGERLQEQDKHQETLSYLEESFKKIEETNELALQDSLRNKAQKLLLKNGSHWISRIMRTLKTEKKTSKEVLSNGISEEKMSLALSLETQLRSISKLEDLQKVQALAGESQQYPVEAVKTFEDLFHEEEADATSKSGKSSRNHEVLKYFRAGKIEAEKALELLGEESINWKLVSSKQELAVEYWEKALKAYQGSSGQQKQDPNQNSSQSGKGERQESDPSGQQSGDMEEASVSEMNEGEMGNSKDNSLRDILQKLQEMQQDDQIRPKQKQTPKKGLRPW